MVSFNKIVISVASLILVAALFIIAIFISKSLQKDKFPPIISDCPDYWDVSYNSKNEIICNNKSTINSGSGNNNCNNYPTDKFKSNGSNEEDVLCTKYKWAKNCGIVWDGVTNNSEPCTLAKV